MYLTFCESSIPWFFCGNLQPKGFTSMSVCITISLMDLLLNNCFYSMRQLYTFWLQDLHCLYPRPHLACLIKKYWLHKSFLLMTFLVFNWCEVPLVNNRPSDSASPLLVLEITIELFPGWLIYKCWTIFIILHVFFDINWNLLKLSHSIKSSWAENTPSWIATFLIHISFVHLKLSQNSLDKCKQLLSKNLFFFFLFSLYNLMSAPENQ